MTNIVLAPGEGTLEDIVADTKDGVLMDGIRSWSIDDHRLNFQFGPQIAWRIVNGKRTTLYKKPTYDATKDFVSVGLFLEAPLVLIARKDLPAKSMKEFVAYAKANQANMQFGSAGTGSATHLGCVLMNYIIGVNTTHVPYRGTGPAMQDLQGGRIDYLCDVMTTAKPQIDGGAVKGLAVFDSKRSPALPDVPTAAEQGTPDLVAYTWNAIFLPKGTPEPIVKKLHDAALEAMHTPAVHDRLTGLGAEISSDADATSEHLGEFVKSEIAKWAVPIKASGVSAD